MKKIGILFLALLFSVSMTLGISAQATQGVQPYWSETNSYDLTLLFSGSSAICGLSVYGTQGTTKITNCNMYLKDSSGTTVKSWTGNSATGDTLDFEKTATGITSGKSYTLSFSATVHRNGKTESVSGSITKKA